MGKNAQRRRRNKRVAQFLRSLHPAKSQVLSGQAQAFQAEHPDVILNRAARRGTKRA